MVFVAEKLKRIEEELEAVGLSYKAEVPYPDLQYVNIGVDGHDLVRLHLSASDTSFTVLMHPVSPGFSSRVVAGKPYCSRDSDYAVAELMEETLSTIRRIAFRAGLIQDRDLPTTERLRKFVDDVASFHLEGETVEVEAKRCAGELSNKIVDIARKLQKKKGMPRERLVEFADLCWRAPYKQQEKDSALAFIVHKTEYLYSHRMHKVLEQGIAEALGQRPDQNQAPAMSV